MIGYSNHDIKLLPYYAPIPTYERKGALRQPFWGRPRMARLWPAYVFLNTWYFQMRRTAYIIETEEQVNSIFNPSLSTEHD